MKRYWDKNNQCIVWVFDKSWTQAPLPLWGCTDEARSLEHLGWSHELFQHEPVEPAIGLKCPKEHTVDGNSEFCSWCFGETRSGTMLSFGVDLYTVGIHAQHGCIRASRDVQFVHCYRVIQPVPGCPLLWVCYLQNKPLDARWGW